MMKSLFPIIDNNEFSVPDVFDNFFNDFMWPQQQFSMPKVDIEDRGSEYVMTANLPGVHKEDILLSYDNNVLTLSTT